MFSIQHNILCISFASIHFCHFLQLSLFFSLQIFCAEPHFCKINRTKHNTKRFVIVLRGIGVYKLDILAPCNINHNNSPAAIGCKGCYDMNWPPLLMKKRHTESGARLNATLSRWPLPHHYCQPNKRPLSHRCCDKIRLNLGEVHHLQQ